MDYSAELLVVDTFSKQKRRFQYCGKKQKTYAPRSKTLSKDGQTPGHVILGCGVGADGETDTEIAQKGEARHAQHRAQARARCGADDRMH